MFGMNEAQFNIVKQAARRCSNAVQDLIDGGKKYDDIAAKVIDEHYEPIKVLVTRLQFVWLIGYLKGRFGQSGEYE